MKKQDRAKQHEEHNEHDLGQQLEEANEGWKRARADYENLSKRLLEEVAQARTQGTRGTLEALLPVIDNFESAYGTVPEELQENPWVQGISFIRQQFEQYLTEQGVQMITVQPGDAFDPEQHEAIETVPAADADGAAPSTIVRVSRAGYRYNDAVLRPAGVVVVAANADTPPA